MSFFSGTQALIPEHKMQDDHSYEQYYQSLIKLHMRKIITMVSLLIVGGIAYEVKGYYDEKSHIVAQTKFEIYLEKRDPDIAASLQKTHPYATQTQLTTLIEAKHLYDDGKYQDTANLLGFVINHAQDESIKNIAAYRLSTLYRHTGNIEQAQSVLKLIKKDSAYSALLTALTLPAHSDERMEKLNEALMLSPTPYEHQLIAIAQHENIE